MPESLCGKVIGEGASDAGRAGKDTSQGAEPDYAGPQQFAAIIKADIERFAKVIKEANIRQMD